MTMQQLSCVAHLPMRHLCCVFDLKQSGDQITGSVWHDFAERPIRFGTYHHGKLYFEYILWAGWDGGKGFFDGVLQGDRLLLTVQLPFNFPGRGVAERTTREAIARPPRLPLPELHDVPVNGLARTPPMGWNSWNKFGTKVDDVTVRAMADAMVASGMWETGYTYINIDDTWADPRDAQGNITGNLKFPNMKGLADYVHSKGLKIGPYNGRGASNGSASFVTAGRPCFGVPDHWWRELKKAFPHPFSPLEL